MRKLPGLFRVVIVNFSPWLLGLILLVYLAIEVNSRIESAAYAYPRSIVLYGLSNAKTDDEFISTVEEWKKTNAWGAQIAALRVLCDNDRAFVDSLDEHGVGARVCRIVK